MTVYLNKSSKIVSSGISLRDFINKYFDSTKGIAVAVENEIISKEKWSDFKLIDSLYITVIKATQGG